MIKNNIKAYLSLDTSNESGIISIFDKNTIYYEKNCHEKNKHAPMISHYMYEGLNFCEENHIEIIGISSGLGPGSFVGIRVSLATALGFSLAKNVPITGIDSHLALMLSTIFQPKKTYVVTKAYGEFFYVSYFEELVELNNKFTTNIKDLINIIKNNRNCDLVCDKNIPELSIYFNNIYDLTGPSSLGLKRAVFLKVSPNNFLENEIDKIKAFYVNEPNVKKNY